MIRTIHFHGRLGKKLGSIWKLDVRSPQEAIHAIQTQSKKLYEYLRRSGDRGVAYKVVVGDNTVCTPAELLHTFADGLDFHFFPVPIGAASGGVLQIIEGIVLIIIGIIISYYGGGEVGGPMISMGLAMVLGGVATLLTKQTSPDKNAGQNQGSYVFGGQVNTMRQGGPIPIGYGEMVIGSQVISLSVRNQNIGNNASDATTTPIHSSSGNSTTAVLFGSSFY